MSSWSASAYPGSRRSRSRSPYRGSYGPRPPYPDPSFPPDPYRTDWDAYDRDRAWANYDRERALYDYTRRGRSRSPGDDGPATGRKRRRSASPWERDRYEPRPRYEDYDPHRAHGGFSPRRGQYPPYASRHAPADPHTFDYPASLKQYAEWFRYFYPQQAIEEDNADKAAEQEAGDGSKPRNGIRSKWEKYKKEFSSHQLQRMFEHHRKSPWFAEKYEPSPEFVSLRTRLRKEGWSGRLNTFLRDLESGKFDPDFTELDQDPTSPTKDASANGPSSENMDVSLGPAGAEENKNAAAAGDEDTQNADAEDEAGENEAGRPETNGRGPKDSKHNNRGEEVSVMPEGNQVMIRTIPPDIGRLKLEEACGKVPGFIYLALGDPLQKRNYYRAGWLKFRDDVDMTVVMSELTDKKIEGFKLHVTHNVKPFTNRVRYAPEVASKPERLVKDLANIKILAKLLEEEYERVRHFQQDQHVKEEAREGTTEGMNGSVAQEDMETAEVRGPREEANADDQNEPREKGSVSVERRIEKTMTDLADSGSVDVNDEQQIETKRVAISLDLYISYLRAAFNTCFYCAVITDHVEELQRKCVKHVRKPMSQAMIEELKAATAVVEKEEKVKKEEDHIGTVEDGENDDQDMIGEKPKEHEEKEKDGATLISKDRGENRDWKRNDERWLDWFDSKIALLIDRDGVDPRNYGGKDYEEELTKATDPFIKQEDEGKFRCKTCQKLFKASSFVEKHVANKHPTLVKHLQDIAYFNNFALDPHRIQPFTHAPAQIGNSQQPPPQAYGLQGPTYPPPAGEYGRVPPPYYGPYGQGYPPYPPPSGGYWDYYPQHPFGAHPPQRRDDLTNARRLSDRISGYANDQASELSGLPMAAGLPAKPIGVENSSNGRRGRGGPAGAGGPPPPPPPNAKEDPRAAAGKKVSYHDMDLVAEGDVELNY